MTPAQSANRPDRCRHPPRTRQRPDARVHKNVNTNTRTQLRDVGTWSSATRGRRSARAVKVGEAEAFDVSSAGP